MKKAVVFLFLCLPLILSGQPRVTLKSQLDSLEAAFDVHFVYEASLPLDIPARVAVNPDRTLRQNLANLLRDTDIAWTVKKRYVVLTSKPAVAGRPEPAAPPAAASAAEAFLSADTLAAASITGHIDRDMNFTQTGLTKLDGAAFRRAFATFSSPDVLKTLQALPGVAAGTELLSNLYVHGGDGSDNLFLLDGVPLYQICHLGGIFSAFNTDVIESLDFYKSGFPARFGGRTSSVIDMATKQGSFEKYSGTFSIGLINAQMQYGGPIFKGKTSFNIALRHSWLDTFSWPILKYAVSEEDEKYTGRYALYDVNLNLTHKFSESSILSFNFYDGKDVLRFGTDAYDENVHRVDGYSELTDFHRDKSDVKLKWGNLVGSLSWKKQFSDDLSMKLTAYHSGTMGLVHYGYDDYSRREYRFNNVDREDYTEEIAGSFSTSNYSRIRDYAVKADLDIFPSGMHHLRAGASYQLHRFRPERATVTSLSGTEERDTTIREGYLYKYTSHEASLYAEDEMTLSKRLRINAGLRYTMYGISGKAYHRAEPRLALKYQFSDFGSFKLSYTHMNQFVHQVTTFYAELPTSLWMPSTKAVAPMHSSQIAGGIYTDLPGGFHLDVEGWYKNMDHLLEYSGKATLFPPVDSWEKSFTEGKGRSYGLETTLSYTKGKMEATAGYTLSWTSRKFCDIALDWYPDRNDNRHKINLTFTYRPSRKVELYAGWLFHSGSRVTIPTHDVEREFYLDEEQSADYHSGPDGTRIFVGPYNMKTAPYHRLDLGANFHHVTRHGNEGIWNISLYNAYCRMNPMIANTDDKAEIKGKTYYGTSFVGYSVIPIIPSVSYTLKF